MLMNINLTHINEKGFSSNMRVNIMYIAAYRPYSSIRFSDIKTLLILSNCKYYVKESADEIDKLIKDA